MKLGIFYNTATCNVAYGTVIPLSGTRQWNGKPIVLRANFSCRQN
jgi:hypothetical protein